MAYQPGTDEWQFIKEQNVKSALTTRSESESKTTRATDTAAPV